jgi:hypothetical protein
MNTLAAHGLSPIAVASLAVAAAYAVAMRLALREARRAA